MKQETRIEERKKRNKAKKRNKTGKAILIVLAVIVIALAAFLATIKICAPDFELKTLVPNSVIQFGDKLLNRETTTLPETSSVNDEAETTTKETTTRNYLDYAEFSDFQFDTSKQGNQVGNILNKSRGAITYNSSYVFFAKPNGGVYRFAVAEETNAKLTDKIKNPISLNIVDGYLYFINGDTSELVKFNSSMKTPQVIGSDIAMCYAYSDSLYYITNSGTAGYITLSTLTNVPLYSAQGGNTLSFVGISLSRMFLTSTDNTTNEVAYISVSLTDSNDVDEFRSPTNTGELLSFELENGYFYYYALQDDGTYDLIRQKFGSTQTVTLLEECSMTDYVVVYSNRLYYTELDDSKIKAKELNMNSKNTRTMLSLSDADSSGTLAVGYGYQYVFLIGSKTDGADNSYKGTCIYTSSSKDNTMTFKDGKWKY